MFNWCIRVGSFIASLAVMVLNIAVAAANEPIKIGVIKNPTSGPFFIAKDRGYFGAEGLEAEFVYFDAPQAMGPAVVSGAIDVAAVNANGAFLNLAAQGALWIIAGGVEEARGFHDYAIVASAAAYKAGLQTFTDLPGHSVAVGTVASPPSYSLALLETKYHLDPARIQVLALQSIPNMASAVVGGRADAAVIPTASIIPAVGRDEAEILGYVGDETPWQLSVVFMGTKSLERSEFVIHFLAAYRKGIHDYDDAFVDENGNRRNGANAADVIATISKYVDLPGEHVDATIAYINPQGRLDIDDLKRQIDWYKSMGVVKSDIDSDKIIDMRYAKPLTQVQK